MARYVLRRRDRHLLSDSLVDGLLVVGLHGRAPSLLHVRRVPRVEGRAARAGRRAPGAPAAAAVRPLQRRRQLPHREPTTTGATTAPRARRPRRHHVVRHPVPRVLRHRLDRERGADVRAPALAVSRASAMEHQHRVAAGACVRVLVDAGAQRLADASHDRDASLVPRQRHEFRNWRDRVIDLDVVLEGGVATSHSLLGALTHSLTQSRKRVTVAW